MDVINQLTEVATAIPQSFDLKKLILGNQLASGGLIIATFGFLLAFLRTLPMTIYKTIRKAIVITIEIESASSSFYRSRVLRNISPYRLKTMSNRLETDFQYQDATDDYKTAFRVGIGSFYCRKGFFIKVIRERTTDKMQMNEFLYLESFVWNKKRLELLIDQLMNTSVKTTNVYTNDGSEWNEKNVFRGRLWDDIILAPGVKERIITDIEQFKNNRSWYQSRRASHQRGYCLHGLPGSGKTSIASAIATTLGKNLYILTLTKLTTDHNLADLLANADGVVLLEDIDAVLDKRKVLIEGASFTFSGILNSLNAANPDLKSRVIIMTSNHPENLDPALIRPGRIDQIIHIGCIGADQAVELFHVFHGTEHTDIEADIRSVVGNRLVQPVILREVYINQKRDIYNIPQALQEALDAELDEFSPSPIDTSKAKKPYPKHNKDHEEECAKGRAEFEEECAREPSKEWKVTVTDKESQNFLQSNSFWEEMNARDAKNS